MDAPQEGRPAALPPHEAHHQVQLFAVHEVAGRTITPQIVKDTQGLTIPGAALPSRAPMGVLGGDTSKKEAVMGKELTSEEHAAIARVLYAIKGEDRCVVRAASLPSVCSVLCARPFAPLVSDILPVRSVRRPSCSPFSRLPACHRVMVAGERVMVEGDGFTGRRGDD